MLQKTEIANRILHNQHCDQRKKGHWNCLPQRDAEPPDSLHFKADRLGCADEFAVDNSAAHLVQEVAQMGGKGICGRVTAGQLADQFAVQIRERLADQHRDHNDRNQQKPVHRRVDEKRQDVVDEEDESECAVENGDASLQTVRMSINATYYRFRSPLTTLITPTRTLGGVRLLETICEMKFAVMPIIAMRHMAWKIRTIWNVAPSAPYWFRAITTDMRGDNQVKKAFVSTVFDRQMKVRRCYTNSNWLSYTKRISCQKESGRGSL